MAENVRGRIADKARPPSSQELALREQKKESEKKALGLRAQMEKYENEYEAALPKGFAVQQFTQDALNCMRRTPDLVICDPMTVLGGFMTFAQMGLRPGVLGQGWLLPFKNWKASKQAGRDVYEAQLVVGYKGYKELAHRSPNVAFVQSFVRYERDEFHRQYGTDPGIHHIPYDGPEDRGPEVGYYAIIKYSNGHVQFEYMSRADVLAHRDRFAMQKKRTQDGRVEVWGPWKDHEQAMCLKTPFRRLCDRYVPLSPQRWEVPVLHRAVEADGTVRRDVDPDPDFLGSIEHPQPDDAAPLDGEVVPDRVGVGSPEPQSDPDPRSEP